MATRPTVPWKSQSNDTVFTYLAAEQKSAYAQDGSLCQQAKDEFVTAWNTISVKVFKKTVVEKSDVTRLLQAYDVFSLRIGALQRSNERIEALIEIGVDTVIGALIKLLRNWNKAQIIREFQARIVKFTKELEEANSEVTKTEVKAGLNALASILSTFVLPEKLLVSLGMIGVHIIIDHALGEPSAAGTVVFVVGDSKEPVSALSKEAEEFLNKSKYTGKALGSAGLVVTGLLDLNEVWKGKEKVQKVMEDLAALEKRLDEIIQESADLPKQLAMLDAAVNSLQQQVAAAVTRGNDAAKNYDAIKAEIDKVLAGA